MSKALTARLAESVNHLLICPNCAKGPTQRSLCLGGRQAVDVLTEYNTTETIWHTNLQKPPPSYPMLVCAILEHLIESKYSVAVYYSRGDSWSTYYLYLDGPDRNWSLNENTKSPLDSIINWRSDDLTTIAIDMEARVTVYPRGRFPDWSSIWAAIFSCWFIKEDTSHRIDIDITDFANPGFDAFATIDKHLLNSKAHSKL